MSANEINSVIDNICTRMGLSGGSAEHFWHEASKAALVGSISDLVLSLIVFIVCMRIISKCDNVLSDHKDNVCFGVWVVAVVVALLCVLFISVDIYDIVICIYAPDMAALKYVIKLISLAK